MQTRALAKGIKNDHAFVIHNQTDHSTQQLFTNDRLSKQYKCGFMDLFDYIRTVLKFSISLHSIYDRCLFVEIRQTYG